MFRQVLGIVLQGEMETVRRCARRAVLGTVAGLVSLFASVFLILAFFLWLSTLYPAWQAALIVAAALLITAAILWGVGRAGTRVSQRRRNEQGMQAALEAVLATAKKGDAPLATAVAALAAGYAVGRRLSK